MKVFVFTCILAAAAPALANGARRDLQDTRNMNDVQEEVDDATEDITRGTRTPKRGPRGSTGPFRPGEKVDDSNRPTPRAPVPTDTPPH